MNLDMFLLRLALRITSMKIVIKKTKLNYEKSYSAPEKEGERCHEAM